MIKFDILSGLRNGEGLLTEFFTDKIAIRKLQNEELKLAPWG
jgi:hypothetical protein